MYSAHFTNSAGRGGAEPQNEPSVSKCSGVKGFRGGNSHDSIASKGCTAAGEGAG